MIMPATTYTTMTSLPPPTINSLDAVQRARLIKSTRKLGKLLGATPHVLDPDLLLPLPPCGKHRRQHDSYRPSSPASSTSSFKDSAEYHETSVLIPTHPELSQNVINNQNSRPKSVPLARPLVLRLRTVPSLPSMGDADFWEPPSLAFGTTPTNVAEIPTPFPPPDLTIPSPTSPLFSTEDDVPSPVAPTLDAIRRKRMAKLTRTLGENIPPELLLPKNKTRLSQHQRSPSGPPPPISSWPDWRKDEMERRPTTHAHDSITSTVPLLRTLSYSHSTSKRKKDRKRSVFGILTSHSEKSSNSLPQAEKPNSDDDFVSSMMPLRRQENESYVANGEWSIKDAEKRAMALRNLRCR